MRQVLIIPLLLVLASFGYSATPSGVEILEKVPLHFIENQGQMDEAVAYYVQGADKTLYFTNSGITFALTSKTSTSDQLFGIGNGSRDEPAEQSMQRWIVKLDFVNANPEAKPRGLDQGKTILNYFKGNPEEWKSEVPTYAKVIYEELWPGIDLIYHGARNQLKYEFVVKVGADPGQIRLAYRGASAVSLGAAGGLLVETPVGGFADQKPWAYQEIDGEKVDIAMAFALDNENIDSHHPFGFDVGDYDRAIPLILDPAILVYCGYIGGADGEQGGDIAVDKEGCAYVVGHTWSTEDDNFPVVVGPDLTFNGPSADAFLAKVRADGTSLEFCGYIGGSGDDSGQSVALDASGCVYVTGYTSSNEFSGFPLKGGPDLTHNGGKDVFIAKFNPAGTTLEYCGYIGGQDTDYGISMVVNDEGYAYVGGFTLSSEQENFPVKVGPDLTYNGDYDAFAAKVAKDGSSLVFCGYIGGAEQDTSYSIGVDKMGSAYLSGGTFSSEEDGFPVTIGPDLTHNGTTDVYVAKITQDGSSLVYCGYIGGSDADRCYGIDLDDAGCAYLTGGTYSSEGEGFPVAVGPDLTFNGGEDIYVAKVEADGRGLAYCGYIGGETLNEAGSDIAVDKAGCAYIVGDTTCSEIQGFPVTLGPDLTYNGHNDAFVAKVAADGMGLIYCGYIGGSEYESGGFEIALDDSGNAYVAGTSRSSEDLGFPVTVGPDLTYNGDWDDIFVAKVSLALNTSLSTLPASTGGNIDFFLHAGAANADRTYLILGSLSGTDPGYPLPGGITSLPINWDGFSQFMITRINTPHFANFHGVLDAFGSAKARLTARSIPPTFLGRAHFAFTLNAPFDFVSNPVAIEIVP